MQDAELEELRRRKMAQLQQSQEAQLQQQAAMAERQKQMEAERQAIMRRPTRKRGSGGKVRMAHPDVAAAVEDQLIRLLQMGRTRAIGRQHLEGNPKESVATEEERY